MRRVALLVLAGLLLLPGCAHVDRPEGIVERWLTSLNQGAAGRPEVYAPEAVSNRVLPGWRSFDPGELDRIEVGRGRPGEGELYQVPFRIETIDGHTFTGSATLENGRILDAGRSSVAPLLARGAGGISRATSSMWFAAAGVAILLILLSALTIGAVRRRSGAPAR